MRLGIFGGTFDPVHFGHLLLAELCREQRELDQVWLLPAAVPPHKQGRQLADAEHRVEMLKLAVAGHAAMQVSLLEVEQGGVCYSVDTLSTIHAADSSAELFFLIGGDSLDDLPNWRNPGGICRLATPVVVARPDQSNLDFGGLEAFVTPERLDEIRAARVTMPSLELSSTEIRRRVAAGQSIRYQTPRAVEKYIEAQGLYRDGA